MTKLTRTIALIVVIVFSAQSCLCLPAEAMPRTSTQAAKAGAAPASGAVSAHHKDTLRQVRDAESRASKASRGAESREVPSAARGASKASRGAKSRAGRGAEASVSPSAGGPVSLKDFNGDGYFFKVLQADGTEMVWKIPWAYVQENEQRAGFAKDLSDAKEGMQLALERLGGLALPALDFENVRVRIDGSVKDIGYIAAQQRIPKEQILSNIAASLVGEGTEDAMARLDAIFEKLRNFQHELYARGIVHLDTSLSNYALDEDGNIKIIDYRFLTATPTREQIHTTQEMHFVSQLNHMLRDLGRQDLIRQNFSEKKALFIFGTPQERGVLLERFDAMYDAMYNPNVPIEPSELGKPLFETEEEKAAFELAARRAFVEDDETPSVDLLDIFPDIFTRKAHEEYHGKGDFETMIQEIALELEEAGSDKAGPCDLRGAVIEAGSPIITENTELYITEDDILVIIDSRFKKNHAGRGKYAVYARDHQKAEHELKELRLWTQFAREEGIAQPEDFTADKCGNFAWSAKLKDWMNGLGPNDEEITKEKLLARRQKVVGLVVSFHEEALLAEVEYLRGKGDDTAAEELAALAETDFALELEDFEHTADFDFIISGATRRGFLIGLGATAAVGTGALVVRNRNELKKKAESRSIYETKGLDYEYLCTLPESKGAPYIKGVYRAVKDETVKLEEADKFLRRVLNEAYLSWMRLEAVRVLIKLNLLTPAQLDRIAGENLEPEIQRTMIRCLGYLATPEAVDTLIRWYDDRERCVEFHDSIIAALGVAKTRKAVTHLITLSENYQRMPAGERLHDTEENLAAALAVAATPEAVDFLQGWYGRIDCAWVYAHLISALGRTATPEAVAQLISWSRHELDIELKKALVGALKNAGTEAAVARLIEWSRNWDEEAMVKNHLVAALSKLDNKDASARLIEWSRPDQNNWQARMNLATALGKINTDEAAQRLIKWSKGNYDSYVMRDVAFALAETKRPEAVRRLIEWSRQADDLILSSIIEALAQTKDPEAIGHLIKCSHDRKNDGFKQDNLAMALGNTADKKSVKRLIAWTKEVIAEFEASKRDYSRLDDVLDSLIMALGLTGTEEAADYLIEITRQATDESLLARAIEALGKIGAPRAVDRIIELSRRNEKDIVIISAVCETLRNAATPKALDRLIELAENEDIYDFVPNLHYYLTGLCWHHSINLLMERAASAENGTAGIEHGLTAVVGGITDDEFRMLNRFADEDIWFGEDMMEEYFNSIRTKPKLIYLILASSQEITSHSFPMAYECFYKAVSAWSERRGYAEPDILGYISEEQHSVCLAQFLFTMTIFGRLEECLARTNYTASQAAERVLSKDKLTKLLDKPALFAKIISEVTSLRDTNLREAFIERIINISGEDRRIGILMRLMDDFGMLNTRDFASVISSVALPDLDPVWHAPQENWVDDSGTLSVGIYWSLAGNGAQESYDSFDDIFCRGESVHPLYRRFSGYEDMTDEPGYAGSGGKLDRYGADKVLVKEFEDTGRKIELYIYSDLQKAQESFHAITITRSHAGEVGNSNYAGRPGTLRFASHCRSIDNSDSLIETNPDSAVITITGTGRTMETNPVLYYLFEYLGTKDNWGDWQDIKDFIRPHLPRSIQKYNFPTDDISFMYSATLEKMRREEEARKKSRTQKNRAQDYGAALDRSGTNIVTAVAGLELPAAEQLLERSP